MHAHRPAAKRLAKELQPQRTGARQTGRWRGAPDVLRNSWFRGSGPRSAGGAQLNVSERHVGMEVGSGGGPTKPFRDFVTPNMPRGALAAAAPLPFSASAIPVRLASTP